MTVKDGSGLVDIAGFRIGIVQQRIKVVGIVAGGIRRGGPFAEIVESHDVSGIVRRSGLVRHPYLHTVDGDAGGQVGESLHRGVVLLAEEGGKEEVTVLLIVSHIQFKRSGLHTALAGDALRRRLLLRHHRLKFQLAELQIRTDTEKARCTAHQGRIARESHVTALHEFHDFVFLALVFQFHILGIIVERGIGVVVQVHIHLVTHLSVDREVDFLIKIHRRGLAVADGQRRIIDVLHRGSEFQFSRSLRFHADTAGTENLLRRAQFEMHIREIEFLLALGLIDFIVFLTVEVTAQLQITPLSELLGSHEDRSTQILASHLRANQIAAQRVVILHLLLHVLGSLQVGGVLLQVVVGDGSGALNLPAGVQQ